MFAVVVFELCALCAEMILVTAGKALYTQALLVGITLDIDIEDPSSMVIFVVVISILLNLWVSLSDSLLVANAISAMIITFYFLVYFTNGIIKYKSHTFDDLLNFNFEKDEDKEDYGSARTRFRNISSFVFQYVNIKYVWMVLFIVAIDVVSFQKSNTYSLILASLIVGYRYHLKDLNINTVDDFLLCFLFIVSVVESLNNEEAVLQIMLCAVLAIASTFVFVSPLCFKNTYVFV